MSVHKGGRGPGHLSRSVGAYTPPIATAIPTNTAAPTIAGIQTQGQTLSGSNGAWDQPVTAYAYKWQSSADGSTGWADVSGATAATYTPVSGDVGKFLRRGVLASNSFGAAVAGYAFSAATGAIAAPLTISGSPPTTATVGTAYSFSPTTAGGHTPKTWNITGKPAWAAFSTSTGQLTGTPSAAETDSNVTITVTDADGLTASMPAFTITVADAAAPTVAPPVEIYSGQVSGQSGTTTATAAASADSGALVAMIYATAGGATSLTDDTGAAWTLVKAASDHGVIAIYKRMVGSDPIVAGTTKFAFTNPFGDAAVYIINLPDATGVPTTVDATGQMLKSPTDGTFNPDPAGTGDYGLATGIAQIHMPAPSAADSYQFAVYGTYGRTANIPGFGSDASWVNLKSFTNLGTLNGTGGGMSVAYRKGAAEATALVAAAGGSTYNVFVWCEVAAPAGGDTDADADVGGGGDGGAISSLAQLYSVLNAGVAANGGKSYTLDAIDLGAVALASYDFHANPITITGQAGTTASCISMSNCHGIVLGNVKVTGYNAGKFGLYVSGGSTDLTFNGVTFDAGLAEGTQNGAIAFGLANGRDANANIQFVGGNDPDAPDILGYSLGVSAIMSNGLTVKDVVIANCGHDAIDLFGALNCTIDHCLGYNLYANIAGGDHPDWIQWAHYTSGGTVYRSADITIRNCGYIRGVGTPAQGYFGDSCDTVSVTGCWGYGMIFNSISASACTDITFTDNFVQSDATYNSRVMIRGGSDTALLDYNYAGSPAVDYTEPGPPPIPNTNVTIGTHNVVIGTVTMGDYTDLSPWLAAHPDAIGMPTL